MDCIPLDVILAPTLIDAWLEWGQQRWTNAGSPRPSLARVRAAWVDGKVWRDLAKDVS